MFNSIRQWIRRRRYRVGRTMTRLIACDIRREVEILGTHRLDAGYITARIRTTNILYQVRGLVPKTEFEEPREVALADLWNWTGQSWGGLADGTSLVGTHLITGQPGASVKGDDKSGEL